MLSFNENKTFCLNLILSFKLRFHDIYVSHLYINQYIHKKFHKISKFGPYLGFSSQIEFDLKNINEHK